jgi:hypothetical protein
MTSSVTSATRFAGVAVPRLPETPQEYNSTTMEQYSGVLRLYFNQINTIINQLGAGILSGNRSGTTVQAPAVYTVSTLPAASTVGVGVRSFVADATATTFASNAIGGGTNKVPVYSDGTNWKIG